MIAHTVPEIRRPLVQLFRRLARIDEHVWSWSPGGADSTRPDPGHYRTRGHVQQVQLQYKRSLASKINSSGTFAAPT